MSNANKSSKRSAAKMAKLFLNSSGLGLIRMPLTTSPKLPGVGVNVYALK